MARRSAQGSGLGRLRAHAGTFLDRITGKESARLRRQLRRLRRENHALAAATGRVPYSTLSPGIDSALTLFDGAWTSRLPGRDGPGTSPLFADARIEWLLGRLGGVDGWRVLELGPLEAGHTWMMERAGAHVTAVEANHDAFLRCLIVKNALRLDATFMLGDFSRSLPDGGPWDLVLASGVLYHMNSPEKLIESIAACTDRVYLWTHYFEPDHARWHPSARARIGSKWLPERTISTTCNGLSIDLVPMLYEEALGWTGFCGGAQSGANWMHREQILALLTSFGFVHQHVAFDEPGFVNGPAFAVLAGRTAF